MAKISDLPEAMETTGKEMLVVVKDGITKRIRASLLGSGIALDPWREVRDKLTTLLFGTSLYAGGYPATTARTVIKIAIFGDSIGASQGASNGFTLQEQITALYAELLPEVDVEIRIYAVPGSWQAQMFGQIDAMVAEGFSPDIAFIFTGTNDGSASIYHSLEGPVVFALVLAANIRRLRDMGAVVLPVSKPPPHPVQSLIAGRHDFSPDFFPTFPQVGLVLGDDTYQELTYSKADQTIKTNNPGEFKRYANGWFAPNQWFRVREGVFGPNALFCHVVSWDEAGTVLTVDDGNGGPVIPYDVVTWKGGYQAKIDARTQLVPARNENDLSRPAGVAADIPLAVEPRDLNGNGVLINASLRHLVIERITAEVASQEAAILVPWGMEFNKELTSDEVYDEMYRVNGGTKIDDYHPNNRGYALFGQALRPILARVIFGARDDDAASLVPSLQQLSSNLIALGGATGQALDEVNAAITELGEFTSERSAEIDAAVEETNRARDAAHTGAEAAVREAAAARDVVDAAATIVAAVPAAEEARRGSEQAAATISGIVSNVPKVGRAIWSWADLFGRLAMVIRDTGEVWIDKLQARRLTVGAVTIAASQTFGRVTTSVAQVGRYAEVDVDAYGRRARWRRPDGTTGIAKLERPGRIDVYRQIDGLLASDAARGPAPAVTVKVIKAAIATGFYPDLKRTDVPTITVGPNGGATQLPGSVLVPMTDVRFDYSGGVMALSGPAFPNNECYISFSKMVGYTDASNTTPVYAGNGFEVEFYHTGTRFEILSRASGDGPTAPDWLMVDGQMVPTTFIPVTPGNNQSWRILVEFPKFAKRLIRLATGNKFGGILVSSGAEISATGFSRPGMSLLGDSWTSGTGALLNCMSWPWVMARALGFKINNGGVGSTGPVQEKQANFAGTGQPLVNYANPYRLAQFCNPIFAVGLVADSQNDVNVSADIWSAYGTSFDDAHNANLHKIVDAWVAAKPGRPLIFVSGTSPSSQGQDYQYFKNRDTMQQVALSRRKDNVFFIDNNTPLTPFPGTGSTGAPAANGAGDLASLYRGGTTGIDTAHPSPAGHVHRGLANAQKVKSLLLTELA
jgi:lysophospholipase L1-like esterase